MATYYVSNSGNDANDGLSEATPWATLSKLKTFNRFVGDDVIKLKCNDSFYGTLQFDGPTFTSEVIVTSYGMGRMPVVSGYKIGNKPESWVLHSTNVWKIDLSANGTYTGNRMSSDVNVGFIKANGRIWGKKKKQLADITTVGANVSQWDFYSDNTTYLYVFSTANPATLASNIEISVNTNLVHKRNNLTVSNIDFKGAGGHGFALAGENVNIFDCYIHEIGGSYLPSYGDGTTRYGNGVEFYNAGKNCKIHRNYIYDIYDVAYTMQGSGTGAIWESIDFRYNRVWNCTQSIEFWASSTTAEYRNCFVRDNYFINAGYGWGWDVRPDKGTDVHFLMYTVSSAVNDITIERNTYYNPRGALYYGSPSLGNTIPFKSNNNYIFLKAGQLIHKAYSYTIEQHEGFSDQLKQEVDSQFFIITDDAVGEISDILTNIASYIGTNAAEVENVRKSINSLGRELREMKTAKLNGRANNGIPEISHLNGFLKPVGGYITYRASTIDNTYAHLGKFVIKSSSSVRFDMKISYMLCADSSINRNGIGTLNLQIVPATNLAAGTQIDLDIIEELEFGSSTTVTANDFVAVVEREDGQVVVGLYFNIGKDDWARLAFQPILLNNNGTSEDYYEFYSNKALISELPAGTQKRPTEIYRIKTKAGTTSSRPTTGLYVGMPYFDTTLGKQINVKQTTPTVVWVDASGTAV